MPSQQTGVFWLRRTGEDLPRRGAETGYAPAGAAEDVEDAVSAAGAEEAARGEGLVDAKGAAENGGLVGAGVDDGVAALDAVGVVALAVVGLGQGEGGGGEGDEDDCVGEHDGRRVVSWVDG